MVSTQCQTSYEDRVNNLIDFIEAYKNVLENEDIANIVYAESSFYKLAKEFNVSLEDENILSQSAVKMLYEEQLERVCT